ncbi:MAG: hypothetical protein KDI82_10940 [Gammaproteobacteria bacterium]|nr:hypothetical protein [Gammaproteobacteria bacterium]
MKPAFILSAALFAAQAPASDLELSDDLLDSVTAGGSRASCNGDCLLSSYPEHYLDATQDLVMPGLPALPERMKGIVRSTPASSGTNNQAESSASSLVAANRRVFTSGAASNTPAPIDQATRPHSASAILQRLQNKP